jgi:hypothetical protein
MKMKPKVGPTYDTSFFDDIQAVFDRYPDAAKKYSIRYIGGVADVMNIDLDRQVAVSSVQDRRIVTEFVDRSQDPDDGGGFTEWCCEWSSSRTCIGHCRW